MGCALKVLLCSQEDIGIVSSHLLLSLLCTCTEPVQIKLCQAGVLNLAKYPYSYNALLLTGAQLFTLDVARQITDSPLDRQADTKVIRHLNVARLPTTPTSSIS